MLSDFDIKAGQQIFYQHAKQQWSEGKVKAVSYKYLDWWDKERVSKRFVKITLDKEESLYQ
jgi:hypothetical protein